MATVTKTQGINLFPLQLIASNSVATGNDYSVTTKLAATLFVHFGRPDTAGALTNAALLRLEASAINSGDSQWFPLVTFRTTKTQSVEEVLTGTISVGTHTLTMASTTGFARGDIVFIKNSTLANSEFHRIWTVGGGSIQTIDGLTNIQTGSTVYNQAEMFVAQVDLTAIGRIRFVAECGGTGRQTAVEAYLVTGDSIS